MNIKDKDKQTLGLLFEQCSQSKAVQVLAYGSRVNGGSHDTSDLDLVVRSLDGTEIDCSILADCVETINESKIPILVELRDYYALPASFHSEINRCNQLLWESTQ